MTLAVLESALSAPAPRVRDDPAALLGAVAASPMAGDGGAYHGIVAWDIRRWDGWRFHRERPSRADELAAAVAVWETPDGRLVGAVHPEAADDAVLR